MSPAKRFTELKKQIERRRWWWPLGQGCAYFEASWKPKVWQTRHRFLFIRTRVKQHYKEPVQLDLFIPYQYGYEFKVILTNKRLSARKALAFHQGRGSQEGIFAELKPIISSIISLPVPGSVIRSICSRCCWHTTSAVNSR